MIIDRKNKQTYTIANELTVNRIGYGAMRLSGQP